MKIAIIGYGLQGVSSYKYWREGNDITICDQNNIENAPKDASLQIGDDYLENLDQFDLIVRSPSVHPRDIINANGQDITKKITTNTNEFFKVCPTKNIIGVTGTKGKGTTSTLITRILEADGKTVHLGGNIGTPPLEMLENGISGNDWVVLELANFQLIDLKYSPHIAVCLMVVPEHLDWHESMDEYTEAKQQLFNHQTENDISIYYSENEISEKIASKSIGMKITYFKDPGAHIEQDNIVIEENIVCGIKDVKLLGKHNLQNICAAVTAVWPITKNINAISSALQKFTGLEHRLELIKESNGTKYYDDSFATTPEAAIVAIQAFKEPKILIVGGSDKGAEFNNLAHEVSKNNVKHVVLIGFTADKIRKSLDTVGYSDYSDGGDTIGEIVNEASKYASPGDVVLLSTGCASFGLFKDYKDRGDQFKKAVLELA
ncbi:MAG: UDP-N-acetylmuramoyl-L-alanine--D-glutamate ligase [bacterium]